MGFVEAMRYLPEFLMTLKKGEYTGDAVILKSTFGKFEPSPRIEKYIESIQHQTPDFSDIDFESFSKATLGYGYIKFMKQQGLKPFRFSGKYKHLMAKNYLPIFYASIHDFYHVLTGFDASFAGEAGVWGFVAGQDISPQAERAVKLARLIFPVAKPNQRRLIQDAIEEGYEMGLEADLVLAMDFRAELPSLISNLRERYKIRPTTIDSLKIDLE